MTNSVISFEVVADADGRFEQTQLFSVTAPVQSASFKLQLKSAQTGRTHAIFAEIHDGPQHLADFGCWDIPDDSAMLGSTAEPPFPIFLPGRTYTLKIESGGFYPDFAANERFSVSIELLQHTTNLPNVMDSELNAAESQANVNAIAFAVSEVTLTDFIWRADQDLRWPEFPIGAGSHLTMSVGPGDPSSLPNTIALTFPPGTYVRVDPTLKALKLIGCLELYIYKTGSPRDKVAGVVVGVECIVHPAMVTQSKTMLQLQFEQAHIVVEPYIAIQDENTVLMAYPSVEAFRTDIRNIIDQINAAQQSYKTLLPTYVASRPLPDLWSITPGYDITFRKFSFREVTTDGVAVGYLIPVFSVKSLELPPPCYCEGRETTIGAQVSARLDQPRRSRGMPFFVGIRYTDTRPSEQTVGANSWPIPDAYWIYTAASICSLGVSKRALREIVRSITEIGQKDGISRGGAVYVSAYWWFRGHLDDVLILDDGAGAVIGVSAEGSARASAHRSYCDVSTSSRKSVR